MSAEGDEIRRERRSRGMTQKQLAAATGVGLRTITRIETGEVERGREGEDADSRSLIVLQRYLRVGPYTPETGRSDDPPLSKASFAELVQALVARHGEDMRNAETLALTGNRSRSERQGTAGLVLPRYDGSRYGSEEEARESERPGETGETG
jgi:transcriptional regulator with XRE-family HTH domain